MTTTETSGRLLGGNRDFSLLWSGGAVSAIGSTTSVVTYPLLVLAVTGSPAMVGLTMGVSMVVGMLAGLPGGVLIDRFDKKRMMLLLDLGRAITQGTIGLAFFGGWLSIPVVLVAIALESGMSAAFRSTEPTAVRLVVPRDLLAVALARNEARGAAAMLAGPALGGLMFGIAPWLPFLVDSATYLISFMLILGVRTSMRPTTDVDSDVGPAESRNRTSGLESLLEGLRFVWGQKFLRTTLLLVGGNNLISNAIAIVAIVLSQQRGDAEITTGLILTIASIGTLAGALIAPVTVRLLTVRTILIANRLIWMACIAAMLVVSNTYLVGALIAVMFFLGPTGGSALATQQMRLTPEHMQGRGRAAYESITSLASPLGVGAVGLGMEATSPELTIAAMVVWMGLMAAIAMLSPAVREGGSVRVGARR